MPFVSKSQARYMFAKMPKIAKEFASKTKSIKSLPNKVKISAGPKREHYQLATNSFKEPKVVQKNLTGKINKIK